ncbi:Ubiquitin Carboxyl-Terminal Hydrolase 24 [Manis pentadactyla]|nr:Ubiquitin Carboxyl-Terminal Hydrolase 24 [Manis pentadactyla]
MELGNGMPYQLQRQLVAFQECTDAVAPLRIEEENWPCSAFSLCSKGRDKCRAAAETILSSLGAAETHAGRY